jgi:nucleotide-binding universal stress UspA family protein
MIEIRQILAPIDFSETSAHALAYAAAVARWYRAHVTALHVFINWPAVNVIPSLQPVAVPGGVDGMRRDLEQHARDFVTSADAADVDMDVLVEEAPAVLGEILAQAARLEADLIVMGTHGRGGVDRMLFGSVTEKVLRKAACPVLAVPPRVPGPPARQPVHFHRILCPVDFSTASLAALEHALSLAEEADATLTLIHAVELPTALYQEPVATTLDLVAFEADQRAAALRRLEALVPAAAREYCTVETIAAKGRPSQEILRLAAERESDLIVMGVQGRGAVNLLVFGSNTHGVLRAAMCPVLAVHAPKDR